MGDQVGDRAAGAADVVGDDRVGVDPARRPVDEHHRRAGALLGHQVAVVVAGRDDQQRVDRAEHAQHQRALARQVLLAGADQQRVPARVGDLLDGVRDRRVERVGEILDHEADGAGAPAPQARRDLVAAEADWSIATSTRVTSSGRTPGSPFTTRGRS